MPKLTVLLLAGLLGAAGGCHRAAPAGRGPVIASATSYLESAARDVLGDDFDVLRLAEPCTCPGHFDIRPSQAAALRRCRALLRFDFQSSLDRLLEPGGTNRPLVVAVAVRGGLVQPASYLSACRQVAEAFVAANQLPRQRADLQLQRIAARLEALAQEATNRVAQAGLRGAPVIASVHQRDFCEWLGLRVVAAFRAADTASVAEIDEAIRAGKLAEARLVIANQPEGRRTADALAERLKARVAVLGNFPAGEHGRASFDNLLTGNVNALVRVSRP